jgi:chaperonin GroEL
VAAIKAPGFGSRHKDTLADLAVLTGGTLLNAEGGRTLEKATLDDLGRAKRITVDKDHTILIGGGGAPDALEARIALLGIQLETTGTDFDRDALQERIAKLAGGVAIIRIGAATDIERNQRMACVEDALNATRAAQEEGIVPGGGVAYIRCIKGLYRLEAELGPEQQVGVALIRRALEEPLRRIAENGGYEGSLVVSRVMASKQTALGFNAASGRYEDLMQAGVIDPTKVVRIALVSAASIAALMLKTEVMLAAPSSVYGEVL